DPSKSPHTIFILKELDSARVWKARGSGRLFFARPFRRGSTGDFLTMDRLGYDKVDGTTTLRDSDYDTIKWSSAPKARQAVADPDSHSMMWQGGEVVHVGKTLNYRQTPGISNYVRAEIQRTEEGNTYRTFTNAIGMSEVVERKDGVESVW